MRRLRVQMRVEGVAAASRAFEKVATGADRASAAYDRVTGAAGRAKKATDGFADFTRQAGGTGGTAAGQRVADYAQRRSGGAYAGGGGTRPPRPPRPQANAADRAWEAVTTSRFGMGGASPLIGRFLRLLSPNLKLSGAGSAASAQAAGKSILAFATKHPAVAVAALAAGQFALKLYAGAKATQFFAQAATAAAEKLSAFAEGRAVSGDATGQSTARLVAMGFNARDIPGEAASFRQRLADDPMAMSAGLRVGVSPQIGREYGGTVDEAKLLATALNGLRDIYKKNPAEGLKLARQLGREGDIPKLMVSDNQWKRQERQASTSTKILGPGAQAAADFESALRGMFSMFDLAKTALGKGAMKPITEGFNFIADALEDFAQFVDGHPDVGRFFGEIARGAMAMVAIGIRGVTAIGRAYDAFLGFVENIYKAVQGALGTLTFGAVKLPDLKLRGGDQSNLAKSVDNLNSTIQQTNTLLKPGRYGSQGAQGAIPSGMSGKLLNEALKDKSLRLGYFNL